MTKREHIAKQITVYREKRSMSKINLAHQVGIHRSLITRYEQGINKVPADTLDMIADILDIPYEQLYTSTKRTLPKCPQCKQRGKPCFQIAPAPHEYEARCPFCNKFLYYVPIFDPEAEV